MPRAVAVHTHLVTSQRGGGGASRQQRGKCRPLFSQQPTSERLQRQAEQVTCNCALQLGSPRHPASRPLPHTQAPQIR
ncbi:hypothetical protein ACRRTK_011999 [Alexandromys fortis]